MWGYYTTEFSIGFVFLHSNTVLRTNNNGHFFVKYLFILENQVRQFQLCICSNNPRLVVSTINGFSQVESSIFNHFGKYQ
jgi:hypothetical protein